MIHNFITQVLEKEAEVHRNTKKKKVGCVTISHKCYAN